MTDVAPVCHTNDYRPTTTAPRLLAPRLPPHDYRPTQSYRRDPKHGVLHGREERRRISGASGAFAATASCRCIRATALLVLHKRRGQYRAHAVDEIAHAVNTAGQCWAVAIVRVLAWPGQAAHTCMHTRHTRQPRLTLTSDSKVANRVTSSHPPQSETRAHQWKATQHNKHNQPVPSPFQKKIK